jgi:hypothetical protein
VRETDSKQMLKNYIMPGNKDYDEKQNRAYKQVGNKTLDSTDR